MNLWDLLIVAAILAAVVLAVRSARKRNHGSCGCGCGCDSCPAKCGKRDPASGSEAGPSQHTSEE